MGQLEGCKKIPNFFFQGLGEVCLEARRPNGPGSIEKLKVSYQVWSYEASTLKKNRHKTDIFPVLQKLTHMNYFKFIPEFGIDFS